MTLVTTMAAFPEKEIKGKHRRRQTPARALKASLRQAAAQTRLTVGLSECVNKLKRNPDSVKVCLLLQGPASDGKVPDTAASNIHHTLLQAFCVENRIDLVRVMADVGLMRLVRQLAGKIQKDSGSRACLQEGPADCTLLLLQHPEGAPSPEDKLWREACIGGHLDVLTSGHFPCD
ncbi:growth arrest and DNA damage-inducible protein GADD45 beta-like [Babylonia areolata]|uniref:growth arrest and DNA damage-inducible protein GADD45 beta-like n=1 Tax=Babylonia areolata TaxID=304850 RepID=UPI003FD02E21